MMSRIILILFLIVNSYPLQKQAKKIKRPKSAVGIASVDSFVSESFDLYDKVYVYDGYAASDRPLEDDDLEVLEEALEDVSLLSTNAAEILSDLDGVGGLKQAKAALQMNRAKKALRYSLTTAKKLLLKER